MNQSEAVGNLVQGTEPTRTRRLEVTPAIQRMDRSPAPRSGRWLAPARLAPDPPPELLHPAHSRAIDARPRHPFLRLAARRTLGMHVPLTLAATSRPALRPAGLRPRVPTLAGAARSRTVAGGFTVGRGVASGGVPLEPPRRCALRRFRSRLPARPGGLPHEASCGPRRLARTVPRARCLLRAVRRFETGEPHLGAPCDRDSAPRRIHRCGALAARANPRVHVRVLRHPDGDRAGDRAAVARFPTADRRTSTVDAVPDAPLPFMARMPAPLLTMALASMVRVLLGREVSSRAVLPESLLPASPDRGSFVPRSRLRCCVSVRLRSFR